MKIATTTADLTEYCESRSIAAPIEGISKAGYKYIDLSFYNIIYPGSPWISKGDKWKSEVEDALKSAEKYGVEFVQSHAPDGEHFADGERKEALITATSRVIEACNILGIPNTVIHAGSVPGGTREDFIYKNKEFYSNFGEVSEKYNTDILTENTASLWGPSYYVYNADDMIELITGCNIPKMYGCWDTGHANVENLNQYDEIIKLKNYVKAFHIQDNYGNADAHVMPMSGTVNFDQILKAMKKIDFKGPFTLEGSCTIRGPEEWPCYRKDILPDDRLSKVPPMIQIKQISVMREIAEWMTKSYNL